MKKAVLVLAVALLAVAMLATPMVACAKPVVWSVDFSLETYPDLAGDWSKFKEFTTNNGLIVVDHIPTVGTVTLVHDGNTMTGVATQMVLNSKLFSFDPQRVMGNEKWVFTFAEGTLEISANFWIDGDRSGGTCVGTFGTGIFEGAIFKGTFDTTMVSLGGAILKDQSGSGEIKFP